MKKIILTILLFAMIFATACSNSEKTENQLTGGSQPLTNEEETDTEDVTFIRTSLESISKGAEANIMTEVSPTGEVLSTPKSPEEMNALLDSCISLFEKTEVENDMKTIKKLLALYDNPSPAVGIDDESERRRAIILASRLANELSKIVFDNNNPLNYNDYYYGMSKMLEGEIPSSLQYEYMTGERTHLLNSSEIKINFFENSYY